MRCDLANMLRQCRNAIDPKRDRYGYAGALEDLEDHVRAVRDGRHTLDEFADFYMIRPNPAPTPSAEPQSPTTSPASRSAAADGRGDAI